jgi:hypothetical protein
MPARRVRRPCFVLIALSPAVGTALGLTVFYDRGRSGL